VGGSGLTGRGGGVEARRSRRAGWGRARSAFLAALLAGPAAADEVDDLSAQVFEIDQEARRLDVVIGEPAMAPEEAAERRLLDAQVLFEVEDYSRSSILFLDVVEQYPQTRAHEDALYYLAESLFRIRNLRTARSYYLHLAARPQSPHYHAALARLVDVALRTGETAGVDDLIARMGEAAPDPRRPAAPYVRAKYLYFRERIDEAAAAFDGIADDHRYGRHARYFAGVCRVKKGDLDGAVKIFDHLARLKPRGDGERNITELAFLALGRVHYERSRLREAVDAYQNVPKESKLFDTALLEVAWVFIKDQKFESAMRALDLLLLASPDSPQVPEVRILQGNLLIWMKRFSSATEQFSRTRDDYAPQYHELLRLMRQRQDPLPFLEELMGHITVEPSAQPVPPMPRLAAAWAREQGEVRRTIDLLSDVAQIERDVAEAASILERLEPAMHGPARDRIFPDLALGRERATKLEKRLGAARDRLVSLDREAVDASASLHERQALDRLARERALLEERLREMPQKAARSEAADAKTRGGYQDASRRLGEVGAQIDSLRAQLQAMDRYTADNRLSGGEAESFRQQAEGVRALITTLSEEESQLRASIEEGKRAAGPPADGDAQAGDQVRSRYQDVLAEERGLFARLSDRTGGEGQARHRRIDQVLGVATGVQASLDRFYATLESRIEQRLAPIRAVVENERAVFTQHQALTKALAADSRQAGATAARQSFDRVLRRFYDVTVMGEVGILDVAWALKQERSDAVSRLVAEQKEEMKILDEGFDDVLEGGE